VSAPVLISPGLEYKLFVVQVACTTNSLYHGCMDLLGREAELAELAESWERAARGQPQMVVIWGRRRVGKTFLLTHFADGKRAIYFTATRQDAEASQLARFADRVREQLGGEVADLLPGSFPDWEAALRFVVTLAEQKSLLVVIDEAPRLRSARGDWADLVSAVWENRVRRRRLMLVLTGSAVSAMEEMLGPKGGLHRRAAVERRLDPFPIRAARVFLPELPAEAFVQAYACCGGYPLHLQQWDQSSPVDDNLDRLAFTPGGLLVRDALDILSEDLDWRGGYERVLSALGSGARRRSRIAGRAQQRIDYTLDRLRRAGYVQVVRPLGEVSADPLYEIGDDYLAFWFEVLREDADLIEGGQGGAVRRRTAGRWQRHLGRVFESAARAHAIDLVRRGGLPADMAIGRWWKDETVEVDVLGLVDGRAALLGEARWQSQTASRRDIQDLRRKVAHIPAPADDLMLVFWARAGGAVANADADWGADVSTFGAPDAIDG
jgi:AAA+ ATPase superfamily predicted ATPase